MTTPSQPTLRIFISHSSKDNDFGVKLVEDLRRALGDETAVWYDARGGLHGGDTWWRKIVDELTARNIFIVVLSPDSVASPWVNDEIDLAWRQKNSPARMRIVPILYRQCQVRADLDNLQIIKFLPPRSYEIAFDELLIALGLPVDVGTISSAGPTSPVNTGNDPESIFVRQMTPQIETAFAEQDWPAVIRKANLLIRRAPGAVTATIYRMQAIALREDGDLQLARDAFDTALALVSDREQRLTILRDYTDFVISQEQWNEVQRYTREALRLAPNDAYWLSVQQQAQSKLAPPKPPEPAAQQPTQAPTQQSAPPAPQKTKEQWLEEGNTHQDAGRYREAIAANDRAIALDPNYASAYYNRGNAYSPLKEYQKAIADYTRAIELDPNHASAYYNRGLAYYNLKEYQKALADDDRAIELNSNYTKAYYNRGLAYFEIKEYQKAIADYTRATELDPKYPWAYGGRGRAYYYLKDYQRAIQDFDHALELDSSITWFKSEREETYRQIKRKP